MDKYDRIDVIVNNAGIMPIAHMRRSRSKNGTG